MYAANSYRVRTAADDDRETIARIAALDSGRTISGPALIGDIDGSPAAVLSLADGRVVADPFRPTAHLVACMRARAAGVQAVAATPTLRDRIRAAVRVPVAAPAGV